MVRQGMILCQTSKQTKLRIIHSKAASLKKYFLYSITIPNNIMTFMSWKKGDEVEFRLEGGNVVLKRKET